MGRILSHGDVAELLGAYALDAVDGEEREAVSAHLRTCVVCQTELAEHREVAGFLGPQASDAPAGLWDRIAGSLEEAPPPLRLRAVPAPRWASRGKAGTVAAAALVAAAVAVVAVIGVRVLDDGSSDTRQVAQPAVELDRAVDAALDDPSARKVDLRSTDDALSAQAVLLPDGTGYVVESNLPPLDPDATYQLWAVVGASKISVGVLGPTPGRTGFKAAGDVAALAITREQAGGVVASDQDPVVVGTLS